MSLGLAGKIPMQKYLLLLSVLNAIPVSIFVIDRKNSIVFANNHFQSAFCRRSQFSEGMDLGTVIKETEFLTDLAANTMEGSGLHYYSINGVEFIAKQITLQADCSLKMVLLKEASAVETLAKETRVYKDLEEELNAILDSSYDGIYITDGNGVTLRLNKACERIDEVDAKEVVGKHMAELINKGYYSESVSLKVIKEKKPLTIIQRLKSGKELMVTGNPIFKNGKITRVVTNSRDMTELNELRRQLEENKRITEKYQSELRLLRSQAVQYESVIAKSEQMKTLINLAMRIAEVDTTVLIQGESGVGKEVLAKIIYKNSKRVNEPFIKVNCGAIPENLLESELFGYEGGAFTGAKKEGKIGLFELANNGTLFLDEVGELPFNLQVKLLRALQEKEIIRVGGNSSINIDVRIIAATNRDLKKAVKDGSFRADLFYRLNVVPLMIPPLRARKEDIEHLAQHFLNKFNKKYETNKFFSNEALKILLNYAWPGNVRELENLIERIVVTSNENEIKPKHLIVYFNEVNGENSVVIERDTVESLREAVDNFEKNLLLQMMHYYDSTRDLAAALKVNRSTITRKFKKYGIENIYYDV
jgi:PAS domain S-box-containing protein/TyrR family helix-turn-helix protein